MKKKFSSTLSLKPAKSWHGGVTPASPDPPKDPRFNRMKKDELIAECNRLQLELKFAEFDIQYSKEQIWELRKFKHARTSGATGIRSC